MTSKQLAEAAYLDWSAIAAAWAESYERTGSPAAKARYRIAEAEANAAYLRLRNA